MASLTIDMAIKGILGLGGRVANRAVEIMKEEASVRDDGTPTDGKGSNALVNSIRYEHRMFRREYAIGPHVDYAEYFRHGRGPAHARNAKYMHFQIRGKEYFRKHVGPARPNHFIERTKERLEAENFRIVE